jgi:hypothetical protein
MRYGMLPQVLEALSHHGLKPVLLMDRLVEQGQFSDMTQQFEAWPDLTFRVCDLGLAKALNDVKRPFQLSLESGHANSHALKAWLSQLNQVERVVLNHQIPKRNLFPILDALTVPAELLILGPLAMYYTPRRLLSWSQHKVEDAKIQADDMGPGEYDLVESEAGTVMRYNKWLSLLPYLNELSDAGLAYGRLDLRFLDAEGVQMINKALGDSAYPLKTEFPIPLLHGFYGDNRSDSVFSKLVGRRPDMEKVLLGEVVDRSSSRLLLQCHCDLSEGMVIEAKDGKQRWHTWIVEQMLSVDGVFIEEAQRGDLVLLKRPRNFPVGTYIYESSTQAG